MVITKRQEKFANAIIEGATNTRAYKDAYSTERMSSKTIWEASSRLSKHPKVVARLDQLRAEKEAQQFMLKLSYEDLVINELKRIAIMSSSANIRIRSLELLGKTARLFCQ